MKKRHSILVKTMLLLIGAALFVSAVYFLYDEMRFSRRQASFFSGIAREISFPVESGPSPTPVPSPSGPYDRRLGYSDLPVFTGRLVENGFKIFRQARPSQRLRQLAEKGIFPIYPEKVRAGIRILDRDGKTIYAQKYPRRAFDSFSRIPPVVVEMLLFIENRELLDSSRPLLNPAVDWGRLGRAVLAKSFQLVYPNRSAPGGSTLATQIEKFRHSENGITPSAQEKIRQIVSGTFRAYGEGENTLAARQRIVLDYINSVPLAAVPGHGEIHGIGDGLWTWYGSELETVIRDLGDSSRSRDLQSLKRKAIPLKQVLSLFIAHKRPSDFLLQNRQALFEKCNSYLRILAREGIIEEELKNIALEIPLRFKVGAAQPALEDLAEKKSANSVRTRLLSLLQVNGFYALDRLDLTVKSTIDQAAQLAVTRELLKLHDPERIRQAGLAAPRLLAKGDPSKVVYSFTLYEKIPEGNVLRVQTDTHDLPFNINEGVKLDLGSTAKLRTLVHYLEIIAELHEKYAGIGPERLRQLKSGLDPADRLRQWVADRLLGSGDRSLTGVLEAAMDRKYSANPNEQFFTGGGLHTFGNFKKEDDHRIMTVREGFRNSVNLLFIRLMQDIVRHHIHASGSGGRWILQDPEKREGYLSKFADFEGAQFIRKFYPKYRAKSPEEAFQILISSVRPLLHRLAAVYRYVRPDADFSAFTEFLKRQLPDSQLGETSLRALYARYAPGSFSIADSGYIARVHPLELWMVAYRQTHPAAGLEEILMKSAEVRREVYQWLFRTSHRAAQERRIRMLLEMEAFVDIHAAWKRLGYPFGSLVPSYATAIGSSADRPSALAELMGILINDGVRQTTYRISDLHFAEGTPYETFLTRKAEKGERLLKPELVRVVKDALYDVVKNGTARRIDRSLMRPDGTEIRLGGKTGTGDNRYEVYGANGNLISSKVVNRTATFAFIMGDRFFGNITAFVPGADAAGYSFTSSLPLAVHRMLSPILTGLIERGAPPAPAPSEKPEPARKPAGIRELNLLKG